MNVFNIFWKSLSWLNKRVLPSYIHRDLTKLKWYEKAIVAWRYFVTKKVL